MTTSSNLGSPIKVSVETFYVEGQSEPEQDKYVFAYSITIKNHSLCSAKLLSRYWLITDANGKEVEVQGEGVVGETPTIAPGESYKYTSGAVLDTPVGTMQGHYTMRNEFGTEFEAPIEVFRLARPNILH
ncbi:MULTISPECIES: Co2+/Mg2+ efflux protein ApaG [Pseudoalteromonas]|jgi:ApaG protein|uniref:Protein ApaG n=3 Tax=Pseudoalteromonas TaxID=53246 RepID=A0A0P7E6E5_9GAMM|nr:MULTISPECIES: Co2+/Mg2+ efflux protein ApaG [Pseudoalteromonas]MAH28521.1 Co2+/Mg2+ efflux protein ApaG [Pseudoalteromonadaceae bacterium]MDC3188526.1 Co2+/Mg2+ efflux protein ApaG [Pseudoalteromonas elyakovii]MEC8139838.1 Co2+/Mg2+ efflux protein ApaG [Pseudomonadota bacterium]KPM77029.1 heavy metal transporter [Pseudoalteromonas sp. UCD-33C]KPM85245.1 heavy metal transporter [Pseudoalteromonas lipolytica]|tara:strand:- start:843 stop:1232 length:390 start_codon:yes stop_codon:yes gene_type:complete